jgi:hypothetical protein
MYLPIHWGEKLINHRVHLRLNVPKLPQIKPPFVDQTLLSICHGRPVVFEPQVGVVHVLSKIPSSHSGICENVLALVWWNTTGRN